MLKNSRSFFILSFLPALAYWYLEENYPVRIAVLGGLALAILEMIFEKIFTKQLHPLSIFNFFLIGVLGLLSLLGDQGIWFKLQPFFTGLLMGGILLYYDIFREGLLWKTMQGFNRPLPPKEVWKGLEKHFGIFLICYGCYMAFLAIWGTTKNWLFFKTLGFYLVAISFILFEGVLMRMRMKTYMDNQRKKEALARFQL